MLFDVWSTEIVPKGLHNVKCDVVMVVVAVVRPDEEYELVERFDELWWIYLATDTKSSTRATLLSHDQHPSDSLSYQTTPVLADNRAKSAVACARPFN